MKVLKFGGTSLGDSRKIKNVVELVSSNNNNCIVVCSAMGGVTDDLVEVSCIWRDGKIKPAIEKLQSIENKFEKLCHELFQTNSFALSITEHVNKYFSPFYDLLANSEALDNTSRLLAIGEQVTSYIVNSYFQQTGSKSTLLNAFDFMHLNEEFEPDPDDISQRLNKLEAFDSKGIFFTQGFICLDSEGQVSNLKRGGSDYTATLVGAAINAKVIEIWTDIDGLHNNDPRYVDNTLPIRNLSFAEAAELAYFGAKILHPSCVWPARIKNVPIHLRNTLIPEAHGTYIQGGLAPQGIKAIAAKDDITIIQITSEQMVNAYGFLKKIFEVFDYFKIPVDTVTTSEISVSITIENNMYNVSLINELEKLGKVSTETNQCIMCVVGDILQPGHVAYILQKVKSFKIKMISLGASSNNITLVLPANQKTEALKALHSIFSDCQTSNQNKCLQN